MTTRLKSLVQGSAAVAALIALLMSAVVVGGLAHVTPAHATAHDHAIAVAAKDAASPCKSLSAPPPTHKNCSRAPSSSPLGSRSRNGTGDDLEAADAPAVSAAAARRDRDIAGLTQSAAAAARARTSRAPFWTVFAVAMRLRN